VEERLAAVAGDPVVPQPVFGLRHARRAVPVRDLAAKLRITAALLGCASQKDLCARFREVNPGTTFDLDRSYKWMQGRAQPRSARVYEDWATLLGTGSPTSHLQSCTVDEFLELVCDHHRVNRDALAARAGIMVGTAADEAPADRSHEARLERPRYRHLVGTYAWYANPWSSCLQGKIIRGSLAIAATAKGEPELHATAIYGGPMSLRHIQVNCPVRVVNRSIYLDLIDAGEQFRLSICLFVPGGMASVLAGVMSGASWFDADPQPAASRIVLIRIPGATVAALAASNRYIDATEPLSGDLTALGIPAGRSAGLEALLAGFLRGDHASGCIKVDRGEYSQLALAVDRMFIEDDAGAGARPLPARARRAARATVRLVKG
jgi:hypothetical protein